MMAYFVILAEYAFEIAAAEKYRPRATFAHQYRFLSEMWMGTGDDRKPSDTACASFVLEAVCSALPWAQGAVFEQRCQTFFDSSKFASTRKVEICRITNAFCWHHGLECSLARIGLLPPRRP